MTGLLRRDGRALIVAEIGNNHEGDPSVALDLVHRAAECGVDAVKFQTFRTEQFVRPADAARFARLKRFELSPDDFVRLADAARRDGLLFISTPLDLDSARMLEPLVDAFKIASGDITCTPLIECVGQSGKPVFLSSGASDAGEVEQAVAVLRQCWARSGSASDLAVLHCVSCYPTPTEQASLRAIAFLRERLGVPVGYSDHTMGIDAAVIAVAVGACIVEKHFTLDKQYSDFRDHQLSADVPEMKALVERVREVEEMLGPADKRPQPCEGPMREAIRRSIVAASDLAAGHLLGNDDLSWMRPATGVAPGNESQLVGRRLKRPLSRGDMLTPADVD
jgi:N,N'-diacetyllegionaminate synthase